MRCLIASLIGLLVSVVADAQGLPSSVAEAYRAYEASVDAEDYEAAASHAYTAWQAAEEADVDASTTTQLAANFGEVALLTGQNGQAAVAYERAVELMGRRHEDVARRATYLRFAAQAHYANEGFREARRLAHDSVNAYEDLPDGEERSSGMYFANTILAYAYMSSGNTIRGGRFARDAMEALAEIGVVVNNDTGSLTFLAAVHSAVNRQNAEAAYYFTLSTYINDAIGSGRDASSIATAWARYLRGEMRPDERAELLLRLQNSGYRPPDCTNDEISCVDEPDWAEEYGPHANVVDSAPENRRPPRYPEDAAMAGLDGLALVRYTVSSEGRAIDPEIIYSVPLTDFGEASVDVLRSWRFTPATVDGVPVDRPGQYTQFEFQMAD